MAEVGVQWRCIAEHSGGGGRHRRGSPLRVLFSVVLSLILLPSCSSLSGPEYQRPDVPAKESWSKDAITGISPAVIIEPEWWSGFGDPYLNELVDKAINGAFSFIV